MQRFYHKKIVRTVEWTTAKGHKKGAKRCPFRAPDCFNKIRLTGSE